MKLFMDRSELFRIASELVQIPSNISLGGNEEELAKYIEGVFKKEGILSSLEDACDGRPNIYALIQGSGEGRSLMLTGHLDTVPGYGMEDPLSGEIRDGRLYGRGSCDMKGALAAMIAALISIKRSGIALKGDLRFIGVIDEEEAGRGTEYLVKNGPFTDGAIVGEPTGLRIGAGNKGLEWMEIKVKGKTVHGGAMEKGVNAISKAAKLITKLENSYIPGLEAKRHPVLGMPTLNFGTISGGDQPSSVPGECLIRVDRRWVPEETLEEVYGEIRSVIEDLKQEDASFDAEVRDMFENENLLQHQPFCTDEKDPLIFAVRNAMYNLEQDTEIPSGTFQQELTLFPAWSDGGFISNLMKASCIILGPGDLTVAHSKEESIDLEQIYQAACLYQRIALEYCQAAAPEENGSAAEGAADV